MNNLKENLKVVAGVSTVAIIIIVSVLLLKDHDDKKREELLNSIPSYTQESETTSDTVPIANSNALSKAQQYLDHTPFSKDGLRHQLEYEGFTTQDIDYALNNLIVDYNEQASKKALQYYEGHLNLSRQGVYNQLIYEKFTPDEAQYGVNTLPE